MSEAATSLQEGRLRRESHEPALPLDWISAVTQVRKGGGYSRVLIYVQDQSLTYWFIFLV